MWLAFATFRRRGKVARAYIADRGPHDRENAARVAAAREQFRRMWPDRPSKPTDHDLIEASGLPADVKLFARVFLMQHRGTRIRRERDGTLLFVGPCRRGGRTWIMPVEGLYRLRRRHAPETLPRLVGPVT